MDKEVLAKFLTADFSQIEMRIVNLYCGDNTPSELVELRLIEKSKTPILKRKKKNWIKTRFYE